MPTPVRAPSSRPRTPAQTVAIWMRKATSVKSRDEFLQALNDGTIDPSMRNARRETLLHLLAEVDDTTVFDAVFARLKRDPAALARTIHQPTEHDGITPLMQAAACGHLPMVNALLREGVDPNRCSRHNGPALHLAAQRWHLGVVSALLEAGAQVNQSTDLREESALSVTALSKALYEVPKSGEERARQFAMVNRLLEAGADPNLPRDDFAMANLARAMTKASEAVVRRLLDAGAWVDVPGISGHTALIEACSDRRAQGDPATWAQTRASIRVLLAAGANVNHVTDNGYTPLVLASRCQDPALVRDLLAAGAQIDAAPPDGRTALMNACSELGFCTDRESPPAVRSAIRETIRVLLDAGANATRVADDGITALHLAVRSNDHTLISDLLAAGADPQARTQEQQTAMDLAMAGVDGKPYEQAVLALELWSPTTAPRPRDRARL